MAVLLLQGLLHDAQHFLVVFKSSHFLLAYVVENLLRLADLLGDMFLLLIYFVHIPLYGSDHSLELACQLLFGLEFTGQDVLALAKLHAVLIIGLDGLADLILLQGGFVPPTRLCFLDFLMLLDLLLHL